MLLRLMRK